MHGHAGLTVSENGAVPLCKAYAAAERALQERY